MHLSPPPWCRPGREVSAVEAERPGHVHAGRSGRGSRSPHQVPVRRAGQALHGGLAAGPLLRRLPAHAVVHQWFVFSAPLFLNQDLRMRCNVCRLRPVKILILAQDGSD